ncbi:MAG TPA: NAD(P)H-dependent oxidoreductase [Solirubrobacterales bacterium]|nr:NAD(P)H-dependent oxidoreductase [Solirubrobacterales bacterium]
MRLLGVSGSLRPDSHNQRLLEAAAARLPGHIEFAQLEGLEAIPPYREDSDHDEPPPAVRRLRENLAGADAILFSTPEYNASLPGQLKNALDWASRPFPDNSLRGKPVAVVGASTGLFGAVWAQAELRKVLATIGAEVVDDELPVGQADSAFTDSGELAAAEHADALDSLLERLLLAARQHSEQPV